MKKIAVYLILMMLIIILIPLLIIKSCSLAGGSGSDKYSSLNNIKVYVSSDKKIMEMNLEEYIKGVVAAEMPADFELEALKAQAVAARTYAYSRAKKIFTPGDDLHKDADICTDYAHCQAWTSKENAIKAWGKQKGSTNWAKIEKAVNETINEIIVYDNNVINPVFHSNSGGKTENAEEVWDGASVPYLKSVSSEGEEACLEEYSSTVSINIDDLCTKIKEVYPDFSINKKDFLDDIKILKRSEGGRAKSIKVGNITMKGTELRKILNLRSTNIKFDKGDKNSIKIITMGYGHGVGMSQWGANYLAKNNESYQDILKHYYKGVQIKKTN